MYHATLNRFASSRLSAEEMIASEPLSVVLSHAIAIVSKYTNVKDEGNGGGRGEGRKKWSWDEWMVWLRLLGVRKPWEEGDPSMPVSDHERGQGEGNERWTWLSDHGPLLSSRNESEWLLERLCRRLDEVLRMPLDD